MENTLIYNIGGLLVIENLMNKHNQEFLRGHDMEISAIAVSNSGNIIATGQKGTVFQRTPDAPIILWNMQTKKPMAVLRGVQDQVLKLQFSPDDKFLACIGANNTFIIWKTQDGQAIHTRCTETPFSVLKWGEMDTAVNPKHPTYTLVTANTNQVTINKLQFDISSMQYFLSSDNCQLPNTGLVRNYNFGIVNGDMLLCGTTAGEICVFSISQKLYRASMPLTQNGIICGCGHGESIFIGGGDGKVKKVAMTGGQWTLTHEAQLDSRVMSINLSNDKNEIICGTVGGKLYRVLTNDLSFLLHSDAHTATINDVAFGTDSNMFVTVDETGALKHWDLSEYKCQFTGFPTRQAAASRVAFAQDDNTVLVGYRDGFLRCFDTITAQAQLWDVSQAHRGAITAIYADQNYILTGGQDGAVRVWNRRTRQLLIQFNGKTLLFSYLMIGVFQFFKFRPKEGYRCSLP